MTATAEQIARLRRMTGEPTTTVYSDAALAAIIALYPLEDARGEGPWIESETTPGTLEISHVCCDSSAPERTPQTVQVVHQDA